jgi:hypothetical protein
MTPADLRKLLAILATEDSHVIGYATAKDDIVAAVPALLSRLEKLEAVAKIAAEVHSRYMIFIANHGPNFPPSCEQRELGDALYALKESP